MWKPIIRIAVFWGWCSLSMTAIAENIIYEVQAYDLSPPVTLSGTVIPNKEVTFKAQLPGNVEYIAGEEGDAFSEETVLVGIDDRELLAKRRSAIAEWRRADVALRNAGMQYQREYLSPDSPEQAPGGMGLPNLLDQFVTKPLSDILGQSNTGFDRRAQLHNSGSLIEQARSALWQAESQIDQIDAKLRDARGLAPFEGVIIKKFVEVGDTVMMGQPLLQFADTQLQIEVNVPARLVRGLKVGKQVSAKLDVLDERIIVTVAQIFPIADRQRHTVKVKFDFSIDIESEDAQYIGPGQYAQVDVPDIKAGQQKLLLIPKAAVAKRGSLPAVCVTNNSGKYERRVVRLGRKINSALIRSLDPGLGDYVSVLSGLNIGDHVVINGESKIPC